MNISVNFAALREAKWYQFALRFLFGGAICVLAGVIAEKYGPGVGGLFLAFPAIFPASATLLESEQKEKKERGGLHGAMRGRSRGCRAVGSAMGTLGMMGFALIVWQFLPARSTVPGLVGRHAGLVRRVRDDWRLRGLIVHRRRRKGGGDRRQGVRCGEIFWPEKRLAGVAAAACVNQPAEVCAANMVGLTQGFTGPLQQHLPPFHYIRVIGNLQRITGILRCKQNRHALLGDSGNQLEDLVHHDWREPQRGFVQHRQHRLRHQTAADRAHLLLAPGQSPAQLFVSLL